MSKEKPVRLAPTPLMKAQTQPHPRHLLTEQAKTSQMQFHSSHNLRCAQDLNSYCPPASVRLPATDNRDPYTHKQGPWDKEVRI